jgi:hypothetical protein
MIRRLLALERPGSMEIWGVDVDAVSCTASLGHAARDLERKGYTLAEPLRDTRSGASRGVFREGMVEGAKGGKVRRVRAVRGDFLGSRFLSRIRGTPFDFVTAHAFLDLLPLGEALDRVSAILRDEGCLYAAINYDGLTRFLPRYGDGELEDALLAHYDAAMDLRRKCGMPTGGSRTGSLLYGALLERGFEILACGCSDWQVFPRGGRYRDREKFFLEYLLDLIVAENRNNLRADPRKLDTWREERLGAVGRGGLALITHQTDILAKKGGETAVET